MDNVLIDDRRIHVDFSQSVAKIKWKGKGTTAEFSEHLHIWFLLSLSSPLAFKNPFTSCDLRLFLILVSGGKYTKEDFKAYEKDLEIRSKLALKDQVKPKQEYPHVSMLGVILFYCFS